MLTDGRKPNEESEDQKSTDIASIQTEGVAVWLHKAGGCMHVMCAAVLSTTTQVAGIHHMYCVPLARIVHLKWIYARCSCVAAWCIVQCLPCTLRTWLS